MTKEQRIKAALEDFRTFPSWKRRVIIFAVRSPRLIGALLIRLLLVLPKQTK